MNWREQPSSLIKDLEWALGEIEHPFNYSSLDNAHIWQPDTEMKVGRYMAISVKDKKAKIDLWEINKKPEIIAIVTEQEAQYGSTKALINYPHRNLFAHYFQAPGNTTLDLKTKETMIYHDTDNPRNWLERFVELYAQNPLK